MEILWDKLKNLSKLSQNKSIAAKSKETLSRWRNEDQEKPLKIYPHQKKIIKNAFYSPQDHTIQFGFVKNKTGDIVWSCQSLDIVAHETGHAVFHRVKPDANQFSGAFNEAFGDLTAVFLLNGYKV